MRASCLAGASGCERECCREYQMMSMRERARGLTVVSRPESGCMMMDVDVPCKSLISCMHTVRPQPVHGPFRGRCSPTSTYDAGRRYVDSRRAATGRVTNRPRRGPVAEMCTPEMTIDDVNDWTLPSVRRAHARPATLPRPRVGRARKGWAALFTLDVRTRSEVARYSHRPSTGQPWRSHVRASALCARACPWRQNPEGVLACEAPGMVRGLQTLIGIGTRGGEDGRSSEFGVGGS